MEGQDFVSRKNRLKFHQAKEEHLQFRKKPTIAEKVTENLNAGKRTPTNFERALRKATLIRIEDAKKVLSHDDQCIEIVKKRYGADLFTDD
jgi:hypothetical protein